MPASTLQTFVVPTISGQTAASNEAAVGLLDNSLEYIEGALNTLAGQLAEAGSKNAIIRHDVPISSAVTAGTLVYFNTETSLFEPALALLEAIPGDQGESIEAPCARVEGLVLRTDTAQATGTMLCGGYYEDVDENTHDAGAIIQNCLGVNAAAGIYYLSPYTAGKATQDTDGLLRQPVLSYYGNGKFSLSLFYMAHDNHYHTSAVLSGSTVGGAVSSGWVAVSPDDEDAPSGAKWVYDGSLLASSYVGVLSPITTAVFWNGVLQNILDDPADSVDIRTFVINKGALYARTTQAPAINSVVIFNHFPFAYNSPVLRSIQSTNENMLSISNVNGIVTITPYDFVAAGSTPSAMAVASIVGGTVSYTPVVTGIAEGPGIHVTRELNGVTTISQATMVGDLMDAYSIQHNGSTVISDGVLQFITFPANRSSEFIMCLPIADVPEGTVLQASAWGTLYGYATSLSVNGYFIPQPTADNNVVMPDTSNTTNTSTMSFNGGADVLSYAEVELAGCTITTPGMLVARVRPASNPPASNIQLLRVGFKLDIAHSNTTAATTPSGDTGVISGELIAAQSIAAGQAVFINTNGQLAVCSASNSNHAGLCVGIALNGGSAGSTITYIISGITSGGYGMTPGSPVYIGADGTLVSLMTESDIEAFYNSAAFLQRVGTAVTSNLVQVNIEPAVTKGV